MSHLNCSCAEVQVKTARITFLTTTEKMAQLQNIVNQQMANYTYGTEKPTINKLLNTAVDEYLESIGEEETKCTESNSIPHPCHSADPLHIAHRKKLKMLG